MEQVRVVWWVEFIGDDWLMPDVESFPDYISAKDWADPAKFVPGVRPTRIFATIETVTEFYNEEL